MLKKLGDYLILMGQTFRRPDKMPVFRKQLMNEFYNLGVSSFGIVSILSVFVGAVAAILVSYNTDNPLLPQKLVGFATRQMVILEFSPTIICIILAGKLGSQITSELGTMRVTQQLDALEIMGVNPAAYIILPKVCGLITMMPFLVIFATASGIGGAYATAYIMGIITPADLTEGLQHDFHQWFFWMGVVKSLFFAFIIASVSSYYGYRVEGGSQEVGKASTNAVVACSMLILFSDVFLTSILS